MDNYEKKYKEALEWARKVMQGKIGFVLDDVLEKFPELKESEDERIRRRIIQALHGDVLEISEIKEAVAWLEKRGEKEAKGNERKIPIPEPPLTTKHAKEVMGIKQNDAWSEEDEKCIENAIMYCEWARDIAPNLHCYETTEKSINWLKSLKERCNWKPSDEQMNALNYVVNLMASSERPTENDLYYNILKSLRQQLMKLKG